MAHVTYPVQNYDTADELRVVIKNMEASFRKIEWLLSGDSSGDPTLVREASDIARGWLPEKVERNAK